MSGIAKYKVSGRPTEEMMNTFATRIAHYMNMFTEDSHYTNMDPAARDAATAALYAQPKCQNSFSPYAVVPLGDDPDAYLAMVNAEIDSISQKSDLSIEDRVSRLHCAFAAFGVYDEYKVRLAYHDDPKIHLRVSTQAGKIHTAWARQFFAAQGIPMRGQYTVSDDSGIVTLPPSSHSSSSTSALVSKNIEELLANPSRLFGSEFKCNVDGGSYTWELESFSQDKSGSIQYTIQFKDMPDRIPMDIESMHSMIQESVLVTV